MKEALSRKDKMEWKAAIDREMSSILENETWKLVKNTG